MRAADCSRVRNPDALLNLMNAVYHGFPAYIQVAGCRSRAAGAVKPATHAALITPTAYGFSVMTTPDALDPEWALSLKVRLRRAARTLGFADARITSPDTGAEAARFNDWLQRGLNGTMTFLGQHGTKRFDGAELVPGTQTVISVRMDYLPDVRTRELLDHPEKAYIARYALGRDYHKLMRKRLARLGAWLQDEVGPAGYRAFSDSAPLLERPLARNAGQGWIGKNTLLLNPGSGSWFFLGELLTDVPLPHDRPQTTDHCGSCTRCLDACPTAAFTKPYELDASRCISYLTIEHNGPIPEEFRKPMGNRIFGCDDCQIVCPWTKFTPITREPDFSPRHSLDEADLVSLFRWDEATYLARTEGMALRRPGYENWQRNIAVALGNGSPRPDAVQALEEARADATPMVREHIDWALDQLNRKK